MVKFVKGLWWTLKTITNSMLAALFITVLLILTGGFGIIILLCYMEDKHPGYVSGMFEKTFKKEKSAKEAD